MRLDTGFDAQKGPVPIATRSISATKIVESSSLVHDLWTALGDQPMVAPFRTLMIVYLFLLVLLPSGSLLGINLKILCFVVLLPMALQVALARRKVTARGLAAILCVPAVFLLWFLSSLLYGFDPVQAIAQYKDVMTTIITCWFAAVLCGDEETELLLFLRWVIYAEVFTSCLKVALLLYAFARGIPVSELIEVIRRIFGVQLMAFDFESLLGRLQFISDNLIPVCLFAILCYRKRLGFRTVRTLLMMLVLVISDLFSFSRYLWVFTLAAFVIGLVLAERDKFKAVVVSLLLAFTVVSLPFLIVVVSLRFSSKVADASDADRIQQTAALRTFIADAPWFGHGLGSYTNKVIRSDAAPYSYEAQLMALLGQIGIVGIFLLLGLVVWYFRKLWPSAERSGSRRLGLLLLLLGWIAGGFFNPSAISSSASVSYAAIFAMAALKDRPQLAFSSV